jgi:NAD(P)-dependent dehydrogenase (short-subunit alcohol dehydrogenase family)
MIAVDVTALTDISRAFLPALRTIGTGYLMNIASVGAYAPIPNQAAYSAAKAYLSSLTEALWAESRGTGLRVMAFSPGVTQTEYFDAVGSTDAAGGSAYQSAEEVVSNALRALGRSNPSPSAIQAARTTLSHQPDACRAVARWSRSPRALRCGTVEITEHHAAAPTSRVMTVHTITDGARELSHANTLLHTVALPRR